MAQKWITALIDPGKTNELQVWAQESGERNLIVVMQHFPQVLAPRVKKKSIKKNPSNKWELCCNSLIFYGDIYWVKGEETAH